MFSKTIVYTCIFMLHVYKKYSVEFYLKKD